MADVKSAFESLGYDDVTTILASGNIVFNAPIVDSDSLVLTIVNKLEAVFHFRVGVTVRSISRLEEMAVSAPFKGITVTPDTRLYVTFLPKKYSPPFTIPHVFSGKEMKVVGFSGTEVFSALTLCQGTGTVDLMAALEKQFGREITTRNWETIGRILNKQ